jgi:hypothetical protein
MSSRSRSRTTISAMTAGDPPVAAITLARLPSSFSMTARRLSPLRLAYLPVYFGEDIINRLGGEYLFLQLGEELALDVGLLDKAVIGALRFSDPVLSASVFLASNDNHIPAALAAPQEPGEQMAVGSILARSRLAESLPDSLSAVQCSLPKIRADDSQLGLLEDHPFVSGSGTEGSVIRSRLLNGLGSIPDQPADIDFIP